jgi:hypothetical protein
MARPDLPVCSIEPQKNYATAYRPKRKLEHIIKKDLKPAGREDVGWVHLAQDRGQWQALVNTVMNLRVPTVVRSHSVAVQLFHGSLHFTCTVSLAITVGDSEGSRRFVCGTVTIATHRERLTCTNQSAGLQQFCSTYYKNIAVHDEGRVFLFP